MLLGDRKGKISTWLRRIIHYRFDATRRYELELLSIIIKGDYPWRRREVKIKKSNFGCVEINNFRYPPYHLSI